MTLTLGILGIAPRADCPPRLRATRLDRFQHHAGELAVTSFLAGHLAAHALVARVGAVELAAVPAGTPDEPAAPWLDALARLLDDNVAPSTVAAPGLLAVDTLAALAGVLAERAPRTVLVYDLPRDTTLDAALAQAERLADCGPARGAWPWVSSLTPGRPAAELLPASCVALPLILGHTRRLSGQHELEHVAWLDEDAATRLTRAGVSVLTPYGPRRQLGLVDVPQPRLRAAAPSAARRAPLDVEALIRQDLDRALATLAATQPHGERPRELWSRAARQATTVLREYERRGLILGFTVRCDEETNHGALPERPVVDVTIEPRARAVAQFALRVGQADVSRETNDPATRRTTS